MNCGPTLLSITLLVLAEMLTEIVAGSLKATLLRLESTARFFQLLQRALSFNPNCFTLLLLYYYPTYTQV